MTNSKLFKFLRLFVISILFAIVSFWSNLTKAQELSGILKTESPCMSLEDYKKHYGNAEVLFRQYTTSKKEVQQDVIVGLPEGDIMILRVLKEDVCMFVYFKAQRKM